LGKTKRTNLPLLQFVKVLEDKIFIIKEVRTIFSNKKQKVSRLVLHTMYKKKVGK
jgi:acyl carrier protein phosphodiesterase